MNIETESETQQFTTLVLAAARYPRSVAIVELDAWVRGRSVLESLGSYLLREGTDYLVAKVRDLSEILMLEESRRQGRGKEEK